MPRLPSIALLVTGMFLLVYGLDAADKSFSASVAMSGAGAAADKAAWLVIFGVAGILAGSFGLFSRREN